MPDKKELILTNARLVLADDVVRGTVLIRDGLIKAVDPGPAQAWNAVDLEDDYLFPGLVELHTDNLEKYLVPRPGILWPEPLSAMLAHDAQVAAAGVTTVFDSIFLGEYYAGQMRWRIVSSSVEAIKEGIRTGLTRAEHLLHLRCEVPDPAVWGYFEAYSEEGILRLVSLNDHTPKQRQWRDLAAMRRYHSDKGWTDEQINEIIAERTRMQAENADHNRRRISEFCRVRGLTLATHDDTLPEHVDQAAREGAAISEFPTTLEAARAAREQGLMIVAGAPNVVRGRSHSNNVSALDLARAGLLDCLSSDYAPSSLLLAVFNLHQGLDIPLPRAAAMVSANPARVTGLLDRGRIGPGLRADLARVHLHDGTPVIRTVWRAGRRMS